MSKRLRLERRLGFGSAFESASRGGLQRVLDTIINGEVVYQRER